ncbi:MAG TPA: diphosphomevalonate decarboxylase [Pseudobdellovibrionaceae bacterium]|nr:diphosphomevalonate decarboxylase [Pseudobdellovibrionaceae bacterium]
MSELIAEAKAPSNIALIKYMGKTESSGNRPANASLSLTLTALESFVEIRRAETWGWRPLDRDGFFAPELSEAGRNRFVAHAERVARALGKEGLRGEIRSANNFPPDCGLASSASSFAALTLAVAKACGVDVDPGAERAKLSRLSQQGSGSSCRSLYSPWAIWRDEGAQAVEGLPSLAELEHVVFVVSGDRKAVSSSEAHRRVVSSELFHGRVERAARRLDELLQALRSASSDVSAWNQAAEIVWAESWDMHALFETARPSFGYFVPGSILVLRELRQWEASRRPLVTMDAGPNVHAVFWRDADLELRLERLIQRLASIDPTIKIIRGLKR